MAQKIITPEAVLSYPHLFQPQAAEEGQKAKYSCALVFLPGADLSALKVAALQAAVDKYGEAKAKDMIKRKQLRMPFRDDAEAKGYPEGSVFINVRCDQQPGIVSIYPGKDGKPLPITDEKEIYAGAIVRASLSAFAYDQSGNRGVSFGLNNLQKLRDGDRLDGRVKAEDEFEADASAVADLSDLMGGSSNEDEELVGAGAGKSRKAKELEDLLG